MILAEGVHRDLQCGQTPEDYSSERLPGVMPADRQPARTFRDLAVWRKAHEFALAIYSFAAGFPRQETYRLALQMRRAAVSIPANSRKDSAVAERRTRRGS